MRELFDEASRDTQAINNISMITGINFSDEQLDILKHHGGMCILACAGSGKALKNGSGVLTPHGYKPIEQLKVLDLVIDDKGDKQVVVGVFPQGKKQIYKVQFSTGAEIECSPDHLWSVTNKVIVGGDWKTLDTASMYDLMYNKGKNLAIPVAKAVEFKGKEYISVSPYVAGFIIASNSMFAYNNTSPKEFKIENRSENDIQQIIDKLNIELQVNFVDVRQKQDGTLYINGENFDRFQHTLLKEKILNVCLWNLNKIPYKYIYTSIENRKRLLEGIIESAGEVKNNKIIITSDSREFLQQIQFICESLGHPDAQIKEFRKERYRITIKFNSTGTEIGIIDSLKIKCKASKVNKIVSIRKTNNYADMTCIKVSSNSELFLTDHVIVTHNTSILTNLIAKRILTGEIENPETLLCTTYSNPGAEEMNIRINKLLGQLGISSKIEVKTMHAVYLKVLKEFGFPSTVIDNKTRRKFLHESCKDAGIDTNDDETFQTIESLISYQINNLLNDKALVQSYAYTLKDVSVEQYNSIRQGFIKRKVNAGVIDFDDMQLYMYSLLYQHNRQDVIDYCRHRWTDIYVDEAQDISRIQYEILKKMISSPKRLVVIGDDDQCLVGDSKLILANGITKHISNINGSEEVLSYNGFRGPSLCRVDKTSSKFIDSDTVIIETVSGNKIQGTLDHIGFAKFDRYNPIYSVCLFYKAGVGYKLGYTFNGFKSSDGSIRNAVKFRMIQEGTDCAWIIDTSDNADDAFTKTLYYSYKYGLPTLKMGGIEDKNKYINDKLYKLLDTKSNAEKLAEDLKINLEYPINYNKFIRNNSRVTLTTFNYIDKEDKDNRVSTIRAVSHDERITEILLSYNPDTTDTDIKEDGKYHFGCNWKSNDIAKLEDIVKHIKRDCDYKGINIEIERRLATGKIRYPYMTLGNIKPGMQIPVLKNGELVPENVKSVKVEKYKGYVYDASVDQARNMIANNILVHNCIYQWRGADPSIILQVCVDYDIERFVLSTNYRCAGTIVEHAAVGIKYNSLRSKKEMRPYKPGGEIKVCDCGSGNLYIMSKYAYKHIKDLIIEKGVDPSQIAVLSRNNNHLSLLGNMLFKDGIHCETTNEMKMTKLFNYQNIKDVVELAADTKNSTLTENTLSWICRFLSKNFAVRLANVQNASSMKFSDLTGYIAKNFLGDETATYNTQIKIPPMSKAKLEAVMNSLQQETKENLLHINKFMHDPDMIKRSTGLLILYLVSSDWKWENNTDKKRTIHGLIDYISDLIKTMGYDETRQFLKLSEQYERGRMAVPGSKVIMSTMHSSKGKEWDNVVLFADDNITFPSFSGIVSQLKRGVGMSDIFHSIDENRRLHYVAMTRARKQLAIFTDKSNVGVYLLEAMGIFDSTDTHDSQIAYMAQNDAVNKDLVDRASKVLFDDKSKYNYKIDISDISASIEIDYLYRGQESSGGISIDDIMTAPPENTY